MNCKEGWALKNWCFWTVVLEKTLENPLDCKEIRPVHPKGKSVLNIHWKDWCWSSNTLATWCKKLTRWKRLWCWEGLRARGEGGGRDWDGCMASPTQWTWAWASYERWWRTGKPGVLQSTGSHRIRHDWATEQQCERSCMRKIGYHLIPLILKFSVYTNSQLELVAQSCLSLCDPMGCSLSGSSLYGILQARILEQVATPFSRRSF